MKNIIIALVSISIVISLTVGITIYVQDKRREKRTKSFIGEKILLESKGFRWEEKDFGQSPPKEETENSQQKQQDK